jgi:hypothetical protein
MCNCHLIFENNPKIIIQKLNNFTMPEVEKWILKK